jgi:aspartyl-tRNA(Asn)/glutamyl-tRNA(Gln) amidotransferase subunit B
MDMETVIGLEVHVELSTRSKVFCGCANEFGGEPNTHCCPVCTGMPGVLPVLNRTAVEYTVKAGLALGCEVSRYAKFDRKGYYYPDLPKAYQISQYDKPLCLGGCLDITADGTQRRVRINRIHLEEDAGKLLHEGFGGMTAVDYNRCGVPLIEIVTEPDMRSAEEARVFLETLKSTLMYIGVSDCKMEEGSLRCDVNVSLRPRGQQQYGTRTEMKNVNSFRAAVHAIDYETKRQLRDLEEGRAIVQETRRWDDTKGISLPMRSKEEAHDYRYFPDPDLVPVVLDEQEIKDIRVSMPELAQAKKQRYIHEYGLPEYDADILTGSRELADFFEACAAQYPNAKTLSNWIMSDLLRLLKEYGRDEGEIPVKPAQLVAIIGMVDEGRINITVGKNIFEEVFKTGREPDVIVREKGLEQTNDPGEITRLMAELITGNPQVVDDYRSGKEKAMLFFVGQIMKATKGRANPKLVNELVRAELDKLR